MGLNVFRYSGHETAEAMRLDHANLQTQVFTIGCPPDASRNADPHSHAIMGRCWSILS